MENKPQGIMGRAVGVSFHHTHKPSTSGSKSIIGKVITDDLRPIDFMGNVADVIPCGHSIVTRKPT